MIAPEDHITSAAVSVSNEKRVRVFVVDDHPIFLEGVIRALKQRPEFELVGSATDGLQALDRIRELQPDVAIIDLGLPQLDGIEILRAIDRERLASRVVILSASSDGSVVFDAVKLGVGAYLTKDASHAEICDAVATVATGGTVLGPEIQAALVAWVQRGDEHGRPVLSPRESEILAMVADGLSAPQVAERLNLSPATVKTHLQHLYEKLGVSDRAAAVAAAMRRDLLK